MAGENCLRLGDAEEIERASAGNFSFASLAWLSLIKFSTSRSFQRVFNPLGEMFV